MFDGIYLPEIGADALSDQFIRWKGDGIAPNVLALIPEAEKDSVGLLQSLARSQGIPLAGAIFPALLTETGFQRTGVVLLRFDSDCRWMLVPDLPPESGKHHPDQLAKFARTPPNHHQQAGTPTLFLLFDGMLPNIGSILHKLYKQLGNSVRYAGVNAGSETFSPMPCLFDQDRLLGNACLAIEFPEKFEFQVEHGYPVSAKLSKATTTLANRIDHINNQPALAVYQAILKSEFGLELTPDNFYEFAVHYPFGLVTTLDVLVRIPVKLTEDGAIYCVGEIPPNAYLRLLHAPTLADSHCVPALAEKIGHAANLVTFYCAGRRMHFGDEATLEIQALSAQCHTQTMVGALSLGEISTNPVLGLPEFHNAALVCINQAP